MSQPACAAGDPYLKDLPWGGYVKNASSLPEPRTVSLCGDAYQLGLAQLEISRQLVDGKMDAALALLEKMGVDTQTPNLRKLHGDLLSSVDPKRAESIYRHGHDGPVPPDFLERIAYLKADTGQYGQALDMYAQVLSAMPVTPKAAVNLRFIKRCMGVPAIKEVRPGKRIKATIATSIPPKKLDRHKACVKSWTALGFRVLSVNPQDEIPELTPHFPEVRFVPAPRDAREEFGAKLVYIDDLFQALAESRSDLCGIVNADIRLHARPDLPGFLHKKASTGLVYGSRLDVNHDRAGAGMYYGNGFDYFFFRPEFIPTIPSSQLCMGLPWWDYFLPVTALAQGWQANYNVTPIARHTRHGTAWSSRNYVRLGFYFLQFAAPYFSDTFLGGNIAGLNNEATDGLLTSLCQITMNRLQRESAQAYYDQPDFAKLVSPNAYEEFLAKYDSRLMAM